MDSKVLGKGLETLLGVDYIDIVFDGAPGPTGGRFVEVENSEGRSVKVGEWEPYHENGTPWWRLRIHGHFQLPEQPTEIKMEKTIARGQIWRHNKGALYVVESQVRVKQDGKWQDGVMYQTSPESSVPQWYVRTEENFRAKFARVPS